MEGRTTEPCSWSWACRRLALDGLFIHLHPYILHVLHGLRCFRAPLCSGISCFTSWAYGIRRSFQLAVVRCLGTLFQGADWQNRREHGEGIFFAVVPRASLRGHMAQVGPICWLWCEAWAPLTGKWYFCSGISRFSSWAYDAGSRRSFNWLWCEAWAPLTGGWYFCSGISGFITWAYDAGSRRSFNWLWCEAWAPYPRELIPGHMAMVFLTAGMLSVFYF